MGRDYNTSYVIASRSWGVAISPNLILSRLDALSFILDRGQGISEGGENEEVFGPLHGFLAFNDPFQLQDPHSCRADRHDERMTDLLGKLIEPVHGQDDVEELQSFSGKHRRIEANRRHPGSPDRFDGLPDLWVVEVLEPEVDVLRHDWGAL